MKTTDKNRLLNDVLRDENYAAFRAGLRDDMLTEVRRQRGARKRLRLLALAACLPAAAVIYLLFAPPTPPVNRPSSATAVAVVRTVPLASSQIVTTSGLTSTAQPGVLVVSTTAGNIVIVETAGQKVELLTDRQLLDLFKGQPVALVTVSLNERHLVFPNDTEQLR